MTTAATALEFISLEKEIPEEARMVNIRLEQESFIVPSEKLLYQEPQNHLGFLAAFLFRESFDLISASLSLNTKRSFIFALAYLASVFTKKDARYLCNLQKNAMSVHSILKRDLVNLSPEEKSILALVCNASGHTTAAFQELGATLYRQLLIWYRLDESQLKWWMLPSTEF